MAEIDNAYLDLARQTAETHGVAIQHVAGNSGPETFTYTVGLARFGQPELLMFGLPPQVAAIALHKLALTALESSEHVATGLSYNVFEGVPTVTIPVASEDAASFVKVARAIYGDRVEALQLCFPDRIGVWPWDPASELAAYPMLGDQWDAIRMLSGNVI